MKRFLSLIVVALSLSSCYISKNLDREVRVSLTTDFTVEVSNTGNSQFTSNFTAEEYKAAFIERLTSELSYSKIIVDPANPEFNVVISKVVIKESTKTETVNDEESEQHGQSYELTSLDIDASGSVTQVVGGKTETWTAYKGKEESVTSNRSGGQIITGQNKDNNTYREKEFSSDKAKDLTGDTGRRSGAVIINKIHKILK